MDFYGFLHGASYAFLISYIVYLKGVFSEPSGPSPEGSGIDHEMVSDTKQMTTREEKEGGKEGKGKGKKEEERKSMNRKTWKEIAKCS